MATNVDCVTVPVFPSVTLTRLGKVHYVSPIRLGSHAPFDKNCIICRDYNVDTYPIGVYIGLICASIICRIYIWLANVSQKGIPNANPFPHLYQILVWGSRQMTGLPISMALIVWAKACCFCDFFLFYSKLPKRVKSFFTEGVSPNHSYSFKKCYLYSSIQATTRM